MCTSSDRFGGGKHGAGGIGDIDENVNPGSTTDVEPNINVTGVRCPHGGASIAAEWEESVAAIDGGTSSMNIEPRSIGRRRPRWSSASDNYFLRAFTNNYGSSAATTEGEEEEEDLHRRGGDGFMGMAMAAGTTGGNNNVLGSCLSFGHRWSVDHSEFHDAARFSEREDMEGEDVVMSQEAFLANLMEGEYAESVVNNNNNNNSSSSSVAAIDEEELMKRINAKSWNLRRKYLVRRQQPPRARARAPLPLPLPVLLLQQQQQQHVGKGGGGGGKSRPAESSSILLDGHRTYHLILNLQLGIRHTVRMITQEPRRKIYPSDFGPKARIWMDFPKEGSQLTPSHQTNDFKWKDYCPVVFRHLRELFKIHTADYLFSICGSCGLRALSSPGKSGSVFYLSNDDRFMIKTMRKAEVKVLLAMLPNYYHHVQSYKNTLITKFFGLYWIKPAGGRKVRFVVMGNMFCTDLNIHSRFDLKGSSQGRSVDKVEMSENVILKDLDLDFVFHLQPSWRQDLLRQIDCDCKFLESQHIMDYSLLLGVHFRTPAIGLPYHLSCVKGRPIEQERMHYGSANLVLVAHDPDKNVITPPGSHVRGSPLRTGSAGGYKEVDLLIPGSSRLRIQLGVNMPARAVRKNPDKRQDNWEETHDVVLYFGIIDILQKYDMSKKLEHAYKSLQFDSLSFSAVDPNRYSRRFQDFIRKIFPDTWD